MGSPHRSMWPQRAERWACHGRPSTVVTRPGTSSPVPRPPGRCASPNASMCSTCSPPVGDRLYGAIPSSRRERRTRRAIDGFAWEVLLLRCVAKLRGMIAGIREIIAACLDREAVSLIYAAKTGRQEFVFSPSALIRVRGRYHLRGHRADGGGAFGERLHDRYVDVIPARAIEAWRATEAPFVGLEKDDDWHALAERRFVLSPELSDAERLCYEHEYGISETGRLKIRKRRALMPYILQELSERRCWRRDGTSARIWEMVDSAGGCSWSSRVRKS